MKKWLIAFGYCLIFCLPTFVHAENEGFILIASTIGPIDSGIVDVLENQF
jgi:tungstate transport system substrate-binding protein